MTPYITHVSMKLKGNFGPRHGFFSNSCKMRTGDITMWIILNSVPLLLFIILCIYYSFITHVSISRAFRNIARQQCIHFKVSFVSPYKLVLFLDF